MKYLIILLCLLPFMLPAQTITPIAHIQDSVSVYQDQTVTIEGIITIGVGVTHGARCNVFIQDDSNRGMMIFDYDITAAYQNDLVRGNEVRVTGEVDEYQGVTELTDFYYQVLSTGNPDPTPVYLELNQYLNAYEGTFVRVVGEIYDKYYAGGGWNLMIEDQSGGTTIIRVWDSTGIDVSEFAEGFLLQAIGVGSIYNNNFQILPGYQDHLDEGEFVNYPYGEISQQTAGLPITISFSYAESFESVNLWWKTNQDLDWQLTEMTLQNGREEYYLAELPAFSAGSIVRFYLEGFTTAGDTLLLPEGFPQEAAYFFTIAVEKLKAVLTVPPQPFNPYRGETFPIEFGSRNGDKVILKIYNAEGKLVAEPANQIISSLTGLIEYAWNGKDKDNKLVPLGLYICFLEVINTTTGSKSTAKAPIVVGAPLK